MFSADSMLKEINILTKVIGYIFVLLALLVVKSPVFLIFTNILFLLLTQPYRNLFIINLICLLITLSVLIYPQVLWISIFLILMIYTILLKKVTETIELRYVLEKTFYRFQKKKVTYMVLYFIYFQKYFRKNLKRVLILKDDYQLKIDMKSILYLLKQAYWKTKEEMQEFVQIYQFRFYNDSKKRTYIEKNSWESWDTNYIMVHLVILLLVFFYGR